MRQVWQRCEGLFRGAAERFSGDTRLRLIILFLLVCVVTWLYAIAQARAQQPDWVAREIPVSLKHGDQLHPAIDGNKIAYVDFSDAMAGQIYLRDLDSESESRLYEPGVLAGPDADAGFVSWQAQDLQVCRGILTADSKRCIDLPAVRQVSLSGSLAVTNHNNTIIRLVNFETMRSRILDSSTSSGLRYDPELSGGRAVWIKERGYAGQYYEPLVTSYDLATDTATYYTSTGGGSNGAGQSLYERRHPVQSSGRIFYQQRWREDGERWDIYEAVQGTLGQPLIEAPGDQINPHASGNFVAYQDNRNGSFNEQGEWVDDWDIYVMDLETGGEISVATSPGDQVNPEIDGNLIVWEDRRNGGWDVYAAALSREVQKPQLGISLDSVFWKSYADYSARDLTVRYRINNTGAGPASQVAIRRIIVSPPEVTVSGSLPPAAASLDSGGQTMMEATFHLPPGVKQFKTNVFISCLDLAARELWYPGPAP